MKLGSHIVSMVVKRTAVPFFVFGRFFVRSPRHASSESAEFVR
jgi:hypothetical protein